MKLVCCSFLGGGNFVFFLTFHHLPHLGRNISIWRKGRLARILGLRSEQEVWTARQFWTLGMCLGRADWNLIRDLSWQLHSWLPLREPLRDCAWIFVLRNIFPFPKSLESGEGESYRTMLYLLVGLQLSVRVLTHILEYTRLIKCNILPKAEGKALDEQ